jgi:2'-5' RNA ligase
VAQALEFFFDDEADAAVRELWRRLDAAGVPSLASRSHKRHRPHVTFAIASSIPVKARRNLAESLRLLSLPALWLYTLGTFPTKENALFLGAVTDAEVLAVHSAVHDVLAGKVRDPWAYYLPGAWVPHCALAQDLDVAQLVKGFAAVHPVEPIRARIAAVGVTDTRTGETELLS